jgi:hypothetical protein
MDKIKRHLTDAGFIKSDLSSPKFVWMALEHRQILHLYNSVLRGYLNYYNFTHNYGRVASWTEFILKGSCAKLLSAKFKLGTMKKTFEKFGPHLETSYTITSKRGQSHH